MTHQHQQHQQARLAGGAEANTAESQSLINRFQSQGFQSADPVQHLNAILEALREKDWHRQLEADAIRKAIEKGLFPEVRGM
jgi:hypothetical protein